MRVPQEICDVDGARVIEESCATLPSLISYEYRPLISVIIIFWNEERFLHEAIQSVLAQTYDRWELLLINDGSSDRSPRIARRYAHIAPAKVRHLSHERTGNRGMSASRNLGIQHARGDYVAFLDGDDVWMPAKLEEQIGILRAHPDAAMVVGGRFWWYSWDCGNDHPRDMLEPYGINVERIVRPPDMLSQFIGNEGMTPLPSSVLVRRSALREINGFEEPFKGMYEDQAFHVKMSLKFPIYLSDRVWHKWRKHPDSCCAVSLKTGQYSQARLNFLSWAETYCLRQRVCHPAPWKALNRALRPYRHPLLHRWQTILTHWTHRTITGLKWLVCQVLPVSIRKWLTAQLNA